MLSWLLYPSPELAFVYASLAKLIGLIFLVILPLVSYTVYAERRVSALIQDRVGPNRVSVSRSRCWASNGISNCPSSAAWDSPSRTR